MESQALTWMDDAVESLMAKVDELGTSGFEVRLRPAGGGGGEEKRLRARYVIWAAGEFQFPRGAGALPYGGVSLMVSLTGQ